MFKVWFGLPLVAKIAVGTVGVLAGIGVLLVGGVAALNIAWGSGEVRLENVNCDPLEPPTGLVQTLSRVLPMFEAPGSPIGPGAVGTFRVPAGDYEVEVTANRAEAKWRWVNVSGEFSGRVSSVAWDGDELLNRGQVKLHVEKGSAHTVRVRCDGDAAVR